MNSWAWASRAAHSISLLCGLLADAKGDVAADGAGEEKDILFDGRNLGAQGGQVPVAYVDAVDGNAPFIHIVGAVDQLGQRTLARSCLPDDGDGFSGCCPKSDVVEHRGLVMAKGDMVKDNLARNLAAVAAGRFRPTLSPRA